MCFLPQFKKSEQEEVANLPFAITVSYLSFSRDQPLSGRWRRRESSRVTVTQGVLAVHPVAYCVFLCASHHVHSRG